MPNLKKDPLFRLVASLTKAEKRHFKLFAQKGRRGKDLKFVKLFDAINSLSAVEDDKLIQLLKEDIKPSQLSNVKRHLYKQIMVSLRLLAVSQNIDIEIREQMDFARILYAKGFYKDSLTLLDKAKTLAQNAHQDLLHLEILEFEKIIELRHTTCSSAERSQVLTLDTQMRSSVINTTCQLSNLGIMLYGWYIKIGHVRQIDEAIKLRNFFLEGLPKKETINYTFFEKIYLYQCYIWFNHILLNFIQCYRYAQRWVDLFHRFPSMKEKDPNLFMQGYNNLLSALFYLSFYSKFDESLKELKQFGEKSTATFNKNSEVLYFTYMSNHEINGYFMRGEFDKGLQRIPAMEAKLIQYRSHLDQHQILLLYYRFACLHFGNGDNTMTLEYLNRIINQSMGNLREDIQCFARILNLIAHYELGHYDLLEYLVKSVYRFLRRMEDLNEVQKEILSFLRNNLRRSPRRLRQPFIALRDRLAVLEQDPMERRSFLYLDILSWLTAKIERKPVQTIIKRKYKANYR